jgi:hypothetical protein
MHHSRIVRYGIAALAVSICFSASISTSVAEEGSGKAFEEAERKPSRPLMTPEMHTMELHQSTHGASVNSGKGNARDTERPVLARLMVASKAADLKLRVEDRKLAAKQKLDGQKLAACEKRATNIVNHMGKTTTKAEDLAQKFSTIADKATSFKATKSIAVINYAQLSEDVSTSKMNLSDKISAAKSLTFTCTSDGPKNQLQAFVLAMDDVRAALKSYKTAVHQLVLGVRQANGQAREASMSATPSAQEKL